MSEPYLGEIRMFGGNFAPVGWALCDGSTLSISENDALFALIGTTYGGDGETTFNLPNLSGRIPLHMGTNYGLGQMAGTETVTLIQNQLPVHTHGVSAQSQSGTSNSPANAVWAQSTITQFTTSVDGTNGMYPGALSPVGMNQPHDNMMPYLVINFIIATQGIFPQQN
ncbi:tail fiber protein [Paenibacillus sp. P26]|nr:tail fiber protein [Paenibacillus sp. P26]UUZ92546.1 tail fiber protein [Paenibacillus sp. P25]